MQLHSEISTQANTNKPVAEGSGTIVVEGHTLIVGVSRRCTEVGRGTIKAPRTTLLVTVPRVIRNEEASEERSITDQQLIGVSVVCTHTVPQSIGTSSLPIVNSGRYRLAGSPLEIGLASSLVILGCSCLLW